MFMVMDIARIVTVEMRMVVYLCKQDNSFPPL